MYPNRCYGLTEILALGMRVAENGKPFGVLQKSQKSSQGSTPRPPRGSC